MPRGLAVFLGAAGLGLALGILKAGLGGGLPNPATLKVMVFGASMLGVLAALLDWGLLRDWLPGNRVSWIEKARQRPIVFREICPPPSAMGLSFYGGTPVGPAELVWPRADGQKGNRPLSFLMQWDCRELKREDATGLLPKDGVLYLFADLEWGDPFSFRFIHMPGPVEGWRELALPEGLPPIYGDQGVYQVPFCSPRVPQESQDIPRLLPKWPFTPIAFDYPVGPVPPGEEGEQHGWYWNDNEATGEALLRLEYPEGVPAAERLDGKASKFERPFAAFPHDYAALRIVAAEVMERLQRPPDSRLRKELGDSEGAAKFEQWRGEASGYYRMATAQRPAARLEARIADEAWQWMERLEPLLAPGWESVVEKCVNVSLGLGSEAAGALPAEWMALCRKRHRLASHYLHDEHPDWSKAKAREEWEARKAAGTLKEVRSVHAPCPNHMWGPASYVQGYAEEHLAERILLLELSTRSPIGHEFGEGVLQFLIRPEELRAGRFEEVRLVASAY